MGSVKEASQGRRTITLVSAVSATKRTIALVDELIPLWQELTKSEDAKALIARDAVNCLLDLRGCADEFDRIDIEERTAA